MKAQRGQPAIGTPGPVTNYWIDKTSDTNTIQNVAPEATATNHRTRSNRRGSIGKGELEDPESQYRNTRRTIGVTGAHQEEAMGTNKGRTRLKHKGETPGPEQHSTNTGISDTFNQDVDRLTRAGKTSL